MIDYPTDGDMIKQDDWLIEKDFSEEKSEQVSFTLSQSMKTLKLYVQMDQREKILRMSQRQRRSKKIF